MSEQRELNEMNALQAEMNALQAEIDANAKPGVPRVTPVMIEASIKSEHYFTAYEGAVAAGEGQPIPESLALLTLCVLELVNGFLIVGKSACVNLANFNKEIGRKVAREAAVREIWPLLGYGLLDQAHQDFTHRQKLADAGIGE